MNKYIHAFWHVAETDYTKLKKINDYFNDFQYAWECASAKELSKAGLKSSYIANVEELRTKLDPQRALEKLWQADIFPIGREDKEFPEEFRQIAAPPFLLYRKGGDLRNLLNRIAIVGTRKSTMNGDKLAFALAKNCAAAGMTVVSGLAFGIDAAAHSGALKCHGRTIGILASGIARVTPSSHQHLADDILANGGAIISEYPVTSEALKFRFLERNRLIAALAHTLVVVEAPKHSGALITANHALDQGREILAFPGDPGKPSSRGCNNLIKNGTAHLVASLEDVLENLADRGLIAESRRTGGVQSKLNLDLTDQKVVAILKSERQTTDDLQLLGKIEWADLLQSLSKLEMAGIVGKNDAMKWQLLGD